ncbi:MAG: YEATS-associated helix-containing protein [Saprospiraceae bacterium]
MDLNMVICPTTLFWYVFFSILSTLIGAWGALYIKISTETNEVACQKLNDHLMSEWRKRFVLALIASLATPLFLFISEEKDVLDSLSTLKIGMLVYFGYSLLLATFAEQILKLLFEIIKKTGTAVESLMGKPN